MAAVKKKDLREMPKAELEEKLAEISMELAKERAMLASGTRPEKPAKIKQLRKGIARIKTFLHQKKMGEGNKKDKAKE
ncbi:MAG: 50S ribosomal protein L29 [Candidatus Diapherotrites archaeon]